MLDVIIVGAGLSGLSAAVELQSKGYKVAVLEQKDKVGGHVSTCYIDGFILDKGLHLFQKAFFESKKSFDYKALQLEAIYPGIMVHKNSNFHLISNPFLKVKDFISVSLSQFLSFKDKMKMVSLMTYMLSNTEENFKKLKNISLESFLNTKGFSKQAVDDFFRPLTRTVFMDNSLDMPAYIFISMLKQLTFQENTLPAYGIGSVVNQLYQKLKENTVRLLSKVIQIQPDGVQLSNGEFISARSVLISIPPHQIQKINPDYKSNISYLDETCMYFATKTAPVTQPVILMNAKESSIINHLFVPTTVQASYAPSQTHLVSVTLKNISLTNDEDELIDRVLTELIDWFGVKVNDWTHLKTYRIGKATPKIPLDHEYVTYREEAGVFYCGDYLLYGSVNNALISGKSAAQVIDKRLSGKKDKFGISIQEKV